MKFASVAKFCLFFTLALPAYAEKDIDKLYKPMDELPEMSNDQKMRVGFTTHLHVSFLLNDFTVEQRTRFLEQHAKVLLTIDESNKNPPRGLTPEKAMVMLQEVLNKQHDGYWTKLEKLRDGYNQSLVHFGETKGKLKPGFEGGIQMLTMLNVLVDRKHLLSMDKFVNK